MHLAWLHNMAVHLSQRCLFFFTLWFQLLKHNKYSRCASMYMGLQWSGTGISDPRWSHLHSGLHFHGNFGWFRCWHIQSQKHAGSLPVLLVRHDLPDWAGHRVLAAGGASRPFGNGVSLQDFSFHCCSQWEKGLLYGTDGSVVFEEWHYICMRVYTFSCKNVCMRVCVHVERMDGCNCKIRW